MDNLHVPPHSQEAEQAVLGGMLLSKDSVIEALDILAPNDFYETRHQWLYIAMGSLHKKGMPIDIVTVSAELKSVAPDGEDSIVGVEYVGELAGSLPTTLHTKHYAQIILEKSMLRRMIETCRQTMEECYQGGDVDEIMHHAERRVLSVAQGRKARNLTHISEPVGEVYHDLANRSNGVQMDDAVPTGYVELDKILMGLHNQDLIILAARPSMGKTAFALNVAQNVGVLTREPTAIFSLEMPKKQLVQRMAAAESYVSGSKLRSGELEKMDWLNLSWGMSRLADAPIYIDDTPGLNIFELRTKLRRMKVEVGLGLVVIDYLQLLTGRKTDNRLQEVSEISRLLKQIARELEVPIVALSQLSRSVEQRQDKRPILSDLRESGAIEQDADVIGFLYREDYYDLDKRAAGNAETNIDVIIAKQRNGPLGTVSLRFLKEYNRFLDLDETPNEEVS